MSPVEGQPVPRRRLDDHELWVQQLVLGDGVAPRRAGGWRRACVLIGGVWLLLLLVLR